MSTQFEIQRNINLDGSQLEFMGNSGWQLVAAFIDPEGIVYPGDKNLPQDVIMNFKNNPAQRMAGAVRVYIFQRPKPDPTTIR